MPTAASNASVDRDEVARFAALAESWWEPDGPLRALHRLNPTRIAFVRDRVRAHFAPATGPDDRPLARKDDRPLARKDDRPLARKNDRPLAGRDLIDVGCGGGLLAEPMARLGARVVAIDAAAESVRVATAHAEAVGLAIDYRQATAEALVAEGARFDVVLAMEIIEHVADRDAFLAAAAGLVAPGGMLIAATLNRTAKAFAQAIIGAEYLLGWLPPGTHDWHRFARPAEIARSLRQGGLTVTEVAGVGYDPIDDRWSLTNDPAVNYMLAATRPAEG